MNFEELQKAWQSQDAVSPASVNTDLLLKAVRRDRQIFRATIFWRDLREVGMAFLLTVYFALRGVRNHHWTDGLVGLACFGVGAFMVVDRLRQRRKMPVSNDSVGACLESSLIQVKHQIWLLKNVFWWYLLPIAAALGISTGASIWHSRHAVAAVLAWGVYAMFMALLYWGIHWLNQAAVRTKLEPRREKLEALLASLDENSQ